MDTLNLIIICVTVLAIMSIAGVTIENVVRIMYLEAYREKEEAYETERHC